MRVIIDIEANGLYEPDQVWLIVCKDIDTGEYHYFRRPSHNEAEKKRFLDLAVEVSLWVGHNLLDYDLLVLRRLLGFDIGQAATLDTLIVSKLVDYSREGGHSIEQYGTEFGVEKGSFYKFTDPELFNINSILFKQLEVYCARDVEITDRVYRRYQSVCDDPAWKPALELEHAFQSVVNDLSHNGFSFNKPDADLLLQQVTQELAELDGKILEAFSAKEVLIREFTPKATKHGTISKTSVPRSLWDQIHTYEVGTTYRHTKQEPFNPSSHKQIIAILTQAGWQPEDKTTTHIECERQLNRLRYARQGEPKVDLASKDDILKKLDQLKISGWKINEQNLGTLPSTAPEAAKLLTKRILLEARRRTLTEWLNLICFYIKIEKKNIVKNICLTGGGKITDDESTTLNSTDSPQKLMIQWLKQEGVSATFAEENDRWLWITITPQGQSGGYSAEVVTRALDGMRTRAIQFEIISERIKGKFIGLGAWTHRMAHQKPNTANIPTAVQLDGSPKLLGKEMRSLWQAPSNRLLVGVDAEGIQLRIFAHYIDDAEFTDALVKGKKDDQTDPHSLNQRILGSVCKTRQAAKRFIYALLLGGGLSKLSQILECSESETKEALNRLLGRYAGFKLLKEQTIPKDARTGYFIGLDGRQVPIPGGAVGERKHLAMSGYLQSGEAVVVKSTVLKTLDRVKSSEIVLVNVVHDEVIFEVPDDIKRAKYIGEVFCEEITNVGIELGLKCPLAGDAKVGKNWFLIH